MIVKKSMVVTLVLMLFQNTAICQRLKVGDKAPYFEAIDTSGDTINLHQYKGQKILVAFFRYAGCPVCNFRIHELVENYDSICSKGYKIIAVYESDNNTLKDYLTETKVPFPIIGDPKLNLYKKYGVEKSFRKMLASAFKKQAKQAMKKGNKLFTKKYKRDGNLTRLPADFIVDENGILKAVHYGTNIGDHLPIEEILNN